MNTLTAVDLPSNDELSPKILESCLSLLPVTSGCDVVPGEVMTVEVRSSYLEFPERAYFGQETCSSFEVDEISLRPWKQAPHVLQSRDRGDRTDLASVDALLQRVIVPACVDLMLTVRNVGNSPQRFMCGIKSYSSVLERRADLRRARCHGPEWWREDHQRLVDLSEEEARRIDAALTRRADGSPRRDLHVFDHVTEAELDRRAGDRGDA